METIQDAGSIPAASILKELKMPEIRFKNDVTVFFQMDASNAVWLASASHNKAGPIQVTSFEKRYTEDEGIVFGLEPDELLKFMNKAASMRFTEEGEQCIAFFDF